MHSDRRLEVTTIKTFSRHMQTTCKQCGCRLHWLLTRLVRLGAESYGAVRTSCAQVLFWLGGAVSLHAQLYGHG